MLDDPGLSTWQSYAVRTWPTLVVIDPDGYVVGQFSGEGHGHALDVLIEQLVADHDAAGTLHRGDGPYVPPAPASTQLRFPNKAAVLGDGRLLVSDSKNHRLVIMDSSAAEVLATVGEGVRGLVDGPASAARFSEPGGFAVLPEEVARECGYDVVVADTVNHALRGLRLSDLSVTTVAGTGGNRKVG